MNENRKNVLENSRPWNIFTLTRNVFQALDRKCFMKLCRELNSASCERKWKLIKYKLNELLIEYENLRLLRTIQSVTKLWPHVRYIQKTEYFISAIDLIV